MALLCKVNWEYFPVFSRVSGIYSRDELAVDWVHRQT